MSMFSTSLVMHTLIFKWMHGSSAKNIFSRFPGAKCGHVAEFWPIDRSRSVIRGYQELALKTAFDPNPFTTDQIVDMMAGALAAILDPKLCTEDDIPIIIEGGCVPRIMKLPHLP